MDVFLLSIRYLCEVLLRAALALYSYKAFLFLIRVKADTVKTIHAHANITVQAY